MSVDTFLDKVRSGERVRFDETMAVISKHYRYVPTRFCNGIDDDRVDNAEGTNEGSCKIFFFAQIHGLTAQQTLGLFGDYYWEDVLQHPEGVSHANIRAFIKHGWQGIQYYGEALQPIPV